MPRPPTRPPEHDDYHAICLLRLSDAENAIQDIRSLINRASSERALEPAELTDAAFDVPIEKATAFPNEKAAAVCKALSDSDRETTVVPTNPPRGHGSPIKNLFDVSTVRTSSKARDLLITDEVVLKSLMLESPSRSNNRECVIASIESELYRIDSDQLNVGRIAQETMGKAFLRCPPLIHPDSWFATLFLMIGVCCILYDIVLIPLQFALDNENATWMVICFGISDAYFLIDIPFTFLLMYVNADGDLVQDWCLIARRYVSTWFALDCVTGMPWQWFDFGDGGSLLRLRKLLRLIRAIPRLLRVHNRVETLFLQVEALYTLFRALKLALVVTITIHWFACIWYFVGTTTDSRNSETWQTYYADIYGLDTATIRYCWSAYYIVTTMTTVGYGDITPRSINEVSFALFLLPTAAIYFSIIMGIIAEFIASLTSVSRRTRQMKRRLALFLKWRKVPSNLRHRVKHYMNFVWTMSYDNLEYEEEIKNILPRVLQEDLCYSLYKEVLEAAPFLSFMRRYTLCMRYLASLVRVNHFEVGDVIFRLGEINRTLYILRSGSIWLSLNQVLSTENRQEDKVSALSSYVASLSSKKVDKVQETQRLSAWHSSYLNGADFKLAVHDIQQKKVVQKLQRLWRARKLSRDVPRPSPTRNSERRTLSGLCSHMVSAPAYIGESCLWSDCQKWDVEPPHVYSYTATCTTRAECTVIDRSMLRATMDRFSPWLERRFEVFQEFVADSFAAQVGLLQWPSSPQSAREDVRTPSTTALQTLS